MQISELLQEILSLDTEDAVYQKLTVLAEHMGFTDSRVYLAVDCPFKKRTVYVLVAQAAKDSNHLGIGYTLESATLTLHEASHRELGKSAVSDPSKSKWIRDIGLEDHEWVDVGLEVKGERLGLGGLSVKTGTKSHRELDLSDFRASDLLVIAGVATRQIKLIQQARHDERSWNKPRTIDGGNSSEIQQVLRYLQRSLDAQFIAYFEYTPEARLIRKIFELHDGQKLEIVEGIDSEYRVSTNGEHESLTAAAFYDDRFSFIPFLSNLVEGHARLLNGASISLHEQTGLSPVVSVMYCRLYSMTSRPGLIRIINRSSSPAVPFRALDHRYLKTVVSNLEHRLSIEQSIELSTQTNIVADAIFDLRLRKEQSYDKCFAAILRIGFTGFYIFIGDHNRCITKIFGPNPSGSRGRRLVDIPVAKQFSHLPAELFDNNDRAISTKIEQLKIPKELLRAYGIQFDCRHTSFQHSEGYGLILIELGENSPKAEKAGENMKSDVALAAALQTILEICAHGVILRHNQDAVRDAQTCVAIIAHESRSPSLWLRALSVGLIESTLSLIRNSNIELKRPLRLGSPVQEELPIEIKNADDFKVFVEKFLPRITLADRRLARGVRDGLIWAKFQSNVVELVFESADITAIVKSSIEELKHDHRNSRGVSIESDIRGTPQFVGVPDLIQSLLVNLLDNAVKYSYTNHPVKLKIFLANGALQIHISNFGTGIHKDDIPHIFTPFYRAKHRDATHPIRGVGLGLPTCKKIVDIHQGRIAVSSTAGFLEQQRVVQMEGFDTMFTIEIPNDLPKGRQDVHNVSLGIENGS